MALPKTLMVPIAIMVVWSASYLKADSQENDPRSAVSYVFCDGFNPAKVSFDVSVQPNSNPQETTKPPLTILFNGTTSNEFLDGTIDQLLGVKNVRVTSFLMSEICFQSLVVDTTIVIDKPTQFKARCGSNSDSNAQSCKNFGSDLVPVFVCPQAMTKLLRSKGIISNSPAAENSEDTGKPPAYDIINDMAHASFAIAEGLGEGTRLAVKFTATHKFGQSTRGFQTFNSFLKGLGPVLNMFGGVTSILTTFLTPNPFEELAKYMKKQFEIVQEQLRDIKDDIENVRLIIESQIQKLAMAPSLRNIRYTTRDYERMLAALSRSTVCDTTDLLKQREVKYFMEATRCKNLKNNLQDLLEVESGAVAEASTGLLKPIMKAYCVSDPSRVIRFMEHVSIYAYGGILALFTYENLVCLENGGKNCTELDGDKNDWLKKLHNFTMKAEVYRVAFNDPARGLELDMKDHLKKIIRKAVMNVSVPWPREPSDDPFPGFFDKVNTFIFNKLYNKYDWPFNCLVKPNADKVIIFGVAQTNAPIFGKAFKPWTMGNGTGPVIQNIKYKVKMATEGYTKKKVYPQDDPWVFRKNGNQSFMHCSRLWNSVCIFRPWAQMGVPPSSESNDRILYFMFNPLNFKRKTGTRKVIANMVPADVYFDSVLLKNMGSTWPVAIACWEAKKYTHGSYGWPRGYHCRTPDRQKPNKKSSGERYLAMIAEYL